MIAPDRSSPILFRAGGALSTIVWAGLGTVIALVVGAGAWSLTGGGSRDRTGVTALETVSDYGEVPAFALTDSAGRTVTRDDLLGRFWIADFIFTRCTGICPILSARMASLASMESLLAAEDVRFVSFTVDPSWDTPEVLQRYAAGYAQSSSAGRWLFLTGSRDDLYDLIGKGFRLNVAERPAGEAAAGELVTHSERFVLVDPRGRIRGYYRGTEEESVRRLAEDLEQLRRR